MNGAQALGSRREKKSFRRSMVGCGVASVQSLRRCGHLLVARTKHNTTMISRDYTKEVGIPSQKKMLPRPVAYVVLAVVAIGISFGVAGVLTETKGHHAAEKAASGPVAPAPVTAPAADSAPAK